MLIQGTLLVAVQLQPLEVVTLTVPLPPSDVNDWLVGEIVKVQDATVTVKVTGTLTGELLALVDVIVMVVL